MHQHADLRAAPNKELQTESLRLTAFLAPSVGIVEPTWWADIVGNAPDTKSSKPGRGELQEAGPFRDRTLTLSVQPGRVDWFLTPHFEEGKPPEVKWAGLFTEALDVFADAMTRWLGNCPPLIRLALGAVLIEPVPDREAGYHKLARYLPAVNVDPGNSFDFVYQINRPRMSAVVKTLKINRLSKWSVASFQFVKVMVPLQTPQSYIGEAQHGLRLELDVNTSGDFTGEFPGDKLVQIFEELENLATEIATQGDKP